MRIYHRRLPRIPFEWHHHPEYELTLTMNSRGKRYIGDCVAEYGADDLVLVPPDLPHTWSSNRSIDASTPQVAIVVWFDGAWARRIADCCREYRPLRDLLRRGACGLAFGQRVAAAMRARLDELLSDDTRRRLAAALDLLCMLSAAPAAPLASPSAFGARPSSHEQERINRVLTMIEARFAEPLRMQDICAAENLSERSLSRYFARHIGESVGRYIARIRIGHACRMLADTALPVSVVAAHSGYASLANFDRQFRSMKAMTLAQYRRQFANAASQEQALLNLTERSPSLERRHRAGTDRSMSPKSPAEPSRGTHVVTPRRGGASEG